MRNALRLSFISYRVAQTKDVATTSLQAGTHGGLGSRIIGSWLRPAEADKWYAIMRVMWTSRKLQVGESLAEYR